MPPPEANKHLTDRQKDLLKRWIAQGAAYEPHWAYVAPQRPPVPAVADAGWVKNPIDAFVRQGAGSQGTASLARGRPPDAAPPAQPRPDRPAADAAGGAGLRRRRHPRRLREAGRPPAGLAALRRADGRARGSTPSGSPTPSATTATRIITSSPTAITSSCLQPQQAVRPVHDRATGRRPAAQPDDRAARGDRLQPAEHGDPRRRRAAEGIPGQVRRRPGPDASPRPGSARRWAAASATTTSSTRSRRKTSTRWTPSWRTSSMGRLHGLRLHAQPRPQGLQQRPPVPAGDRGRQPLPPAPDRAVHRPGRGRRRRRPARAIAGTKSARSAFDAWRGETLAYLDAHPSGWTRPQPMLPRPVVPKPRRAVAATAPSTQLSTAARRRSCGG